MHLPVESQPSGRFPKTSRLLKHSDFQAVYKQGRKTFSGNMTAFYRERSDSASARVGLAVGRVLGGSVQRNRIKRRMRAAVQPNLGELKRPLDVVLHPRKAVLTMMFADLKAEVQKLFAAVEKGKGR
jgi:ribonuclease P protein component